MNNIIDNRMLLDKIIEPLSFSIIQRHFIECLRNNTISLAYLTYKQLKEEDFNSNFSLYSCIAAFESTDFKYTLSFLKTIQLNWLEFKDDIFSFFIYQANDFNHNAATKKEILNIISWILDEGEFFDIKNEFLMTTFKNLDNDLFLKNKSLSEAYDLQNILVSDILLEKNKSKKL